MAKFACLLWRARFGFAASVILNIFLIISLLRSFIGHNEGLNDVSVKRRNLEGQFNHERLKRIKSVKCFIFIAILSSPEAVEKRASIRETWLSLPISKRFKKEHRFVIGTNGLHSKQKDNLKNEHEIHKDLLMLPDHKDAYSNLTLKLLKSFIWIAGNVESDFVLKVDDDSFVRIERLTQDLELKKKYGRIYWGFFRGDANVKKIGKWAEKNWILCDKYLPYANGGGYVLSQDLVVYIARNADMLQIYNSEDVSVGTWLAPVLINRVHDVRFDTEYKSRGCNNKHIVSHKQSSNDMYRKYQQLTLKNRLCEVEHNVRMSFDYNWQVPPSGCCKRMAGIP